MTPPLMPAGPDVWHMLDSSSMSVSLPLSLIDAIFKTISVGMHPQDSKEVLDLRARIFAKRLDPCQAPGHGCSGGRRRECEIEKDVCVDFERQVSSTHGLSCEREVVDEVGAEEPLKSTALASVFFSCTNFKRLLYKRESTRYYCLSQWIFARTAKVLTTSAPSAMKSKVVAPPERVYSVCFPQLMWISKGGCALSSRSIVHNSVCS